MALDAVECALVAGSVSNQALLCPVASLHSPMLTNQLIFLLREACGDYRVNLRHGTLQALTSDSESRRGAVSEVPACGQHVLKLTRSAQLIYEPLTSVADATYCCDWVRNGHLFRDPAGMPNL